MAQHDYVIDNSTGANVRADINNALLAISSTNSGSSAPSTTYAFQLFANTTTSKLQIRNAANSAFVDLIGLDGSILLPDGSVSSPSLAFSDDLNTGIFSSAADTFNVATGGVERMELGSTTIFNESGADVDFRIEGDTEANLFYVDAGNNRIGIGTATPEGELDLGSSTSGRRLTFNSYSNVFSEHSSGALWLASNFYGNAGAAGFKTGFTGNFGAAAISVNATGGSSNSGIIEFFTDDSASKNFGAAFTPTERMRIDSSGNVGIGTSSPSRKLEITDATFPALRIKNSSTSIANGTNIAGLEFEHADSSAAGVCAGINALMADTSTGALHMTFSTGTNVNLYRENMRLDSSGRLLVGSGSVSLPLGTGSGSLDLDNGTIALCVGGNNGSTGRTNSTGKNAFITAPHYTNAEQPIPLITGQSGSADNIINIGGGTSLLNAVTKIRFFTAANTTTTTGTERFRVQPDGEVIFGNTSSPSSSQGGLSLRTTPSSLPSYIFTSAAQHGSNPYTHYEFGNSNGIVGTIVTSGSGTTYHTTSDYRLKENETAITDGITRLKQLKPYKFNFKADPSTVLDGFFAHEVASIVPDAISGEKDYVATEANVNSGLAENVGDPIYQQIDHSRLVPLLVAAVKELIGKVEALEAA